MSTERDTHFLGFATILIAEIDQLSHAEDEDGFQHFNVKDLQTLIAQRAYDLAYHVLKTSEEHDLFADDFYGYFSLDAEAKLTEIPDLTEWPTPQTSAPQDRSPD